MPTPMTTRTETPREARPSGPGIPIAAGPQLALLLGLALSLLASCGGRAPQEGLVIQREHFDDPTRPLFFDLGMLEFGTRHELPLRWRNTDATPVTILEVDPACSCTAAKHLRLIDEQGSVLEEGDLDRRGEMLSIPPGGLAELVVGINTASVVPNREKLAVMRIQTSSLQTPFLTLEIHLETHRAFLVSPASIQVGGVPTSYGGSAQCTVMTGKKGADSRVLGIHSSSEGIEPTLEYLFVNEEHVWTLTARVLPMQPKGPLHGTIELDTIDERGQKGILAIDVWAQVVDDVGFDRPKPHFGALRPGESRQLTMELLSRVPGLRLHVSEMRLHGPAADHLRVEFAPRPGAYVDSDGACEAWSVTLDVDGELPPGRFEAELEALLDDDQYPRVTTTIQGVVLEP